MKVPCEFDVPPALFLQIRGFVRALVTLITKDISDVSFLNWRFEVLCELRFEVWDYHVVAACFLRHSRFLLPISGSEGKERKLKKVSLLLWICMVSNSEEFEVLLAHFGLWRGGKGRAGKKVLRFKGSGFRFPCCCFANLLCLLLLWLIE